jgi:hypothetical protein
LSQRSLTTPPFGYILYEAIRSTDGALMRRAENYNANLRSFVDLCRMHGIPYMAFDYENNTDIDADVLRFINARPG